MEQNICTVCNVRYSFYKLPLNSGETFPICMNCIREKIDNGQIDVKGKDKIEFLEQLSESIKKQVPNKQLTNTSTDLVVSQKNKPTEKAIFALQFGHDLTQKAKDGKLDPLIGRTKEVENTLRIMKRRYKNNPILVGEPGVGKTAIVEGIAAKIAKGEVDDSLKGKKIISLSMGNLVAGTKYRGEFEDRIKNIINEAKERDDIILFLDEIHTLMGSGGGDGSLDGAQMLKPALSRGEVQVIGTTTLDEYRVHIEKDRALERRFLKVVVQEPTMEESTKIINGVKIKYEDHHGVKIPEEVVTASVELSSKYISDRMLPDKAIDLIDEACAHKQLINKTRASSSENLEKELTKVRAEKDELLVGGDFEKAKNLVTKQKELEEEISSVKIKEEEQNVISKNDLAYILQQWTGIPAQKMTQKEAVKLRHLPVELKERVKGQDKAIDSLTNSIKRNYVGLKDDNRPVGTFMMLGPTGVGKTELTKALTEQLFGDESKMIRFDMSEYMEKHSVSKLIGSPPGYVGYEDEGKLTKAIRQNPYSVVLFDEVEKAHPDVFNVLLQLFDEGRISNAKGRVVDGRNIIFIMTSNVGSDLYTSKKTSLGYNLDLDGEKKNLDEKIRERLKEHYRPEFLNRIDEFLIFDQLQKDVMSDIARKMADELVEKLAKREIEANFSPKAIELLAEKGYDPEMGARPLRREIDKLKNLIADKLIEKDDMSKINIGARSGEFFIN